MVAIAQIKPSNGGAQIVAAMAGKAKQTKAPKLAEEATPKVKGVAKSLRNNVCINNPATARAPPLNQAKVARGSLNARICSLYSAAPKCGAIHIVAIEKAANSANSKSLFMRWHHHRSLLQTGNHY
jgi:hypothetical protein